jgi:hypothetical protein
MNNRQWRYFEIKIPTSSLDKTFIVSARNELLENWKLDLKNALDVIPQKTHKAAVDK